MSAFYEEIVLAWKGKEYTVQPDYSMVQKIESRGVSIIGVTQRMSRGEPPVSQVAQIIAHMLQSGGAKNVTPSDVYEHLVVAATEEEWRRIAAALMTAFVPRGRSSGNSEAPANGGG